MILNENLDNYIAVAIFLELIDDDKEVPAVKLMSMRKISDDTLSANVILNDTLVDVMVEVDMTNKNIINEFNILKDKLL